MKLVYLALLVPGSLWAQFAPAPRAAYVFSGGTWAPLAGAGTQTGVTAPQPIGLYVKSGGNWVAWDGTGGGGGATIPNTTNLISGSGTGNGADSGIVPANVALLSGTQTFTGAKTFPGVTLTDKSTITSSSATGTTSPLGVTNNEASSTLMMTARLKAPNMANGGTESLFLGQAETTNNGFLLNFTRITLGDSLNRLSFQPYGEAISASIFAGSGNVNIGTAVSDSGFKLDVQGSTRAATYNTATNCSSAASPAVCAAAASGSVAIPSGVTQAVVVNTTAVTANSQIQLTEDRSLGTRLGVTCDTTAVPGLTIVTARTAGTSFTIGSSVTSTNPVCVSYTITN